MKVRLMGKAQHDSVMRGLISSSNIFLEFYSWKAISYMSSYTLNLDVTLDQKVMLASSCLMKHIWGPFSKPALQNAFSCICLVFDGIMVLNQ